MPQTVLGTRQVKFPLLNSFTNGAPTDTDVFPYYSISAADNRDGVINVLLTLLGNGYIYGLVPTYVSTSQVKFTKGVAYLENGRILTLAFDTTKTPSLSASTWYHCYLYLNGSSPDIEIVTTAPASPFFATARSKTSDNTRRYVGSFRTNSSSQIVNFVYHGAGDYLDCRYRNAVDLENRFITNDSSTTNTTASVSTYVPVSGTRINVRMTNLATTGFVYFDTGELNPAGGNGHYGLGQNGAVDGAYLLLNSSQQFRYSYSSTPTGSNFLYIEAVGFTLSR